MSKNNNLHVLKKLCIKFLFFEGSVDRCMSLCKRIYRVFLIEREYFNFMDNKASWVQDSYLTLKTDLSLLTYELTNLNMFKTLCTGIKRSYNKFNNKYIYEVNDKLYLAYNLKQLGDLIKW